MIVINDKSEREVAGFVIFVKDEDSNFQVIRFTRIHYFMNFIIFTLDNTMNPNNTSQNPPQNQYWHKLNTESKRKKEKN